MPFETNVRYYIQNAGLGGYLSCIEGCSDEVRLNSGKHDNSVYDHWEIRPSANTLGGEPQYCIWNCGTSSYAYVRDDHKKNAWYWGVHVKTFIDKDDIIMSDWTVIEDPTGFFLFSTPSPSTKSTSYLQKGLSPVAAERRFETQVVVQSWRLILVSAPDPTPPPAATPNTVPNAPSSTNPTPPPAAAKPNTVPHPPQSTAPNPPPPPSLEGIDATNTVSASVPEPFRGLYFDIYRGAMRANVSPTGPSFQHVVAIKVLRPGFDPRTTPQARADFETLLNDFIIRWSRLQNDHLVSLLGVSTAYGPFPAMITSWMLNGLLTEYLSSSRRDDSQKMKLIIGVAKGVAYLHSKGVVHSDIRAASVQVDELGNACLTDPGLLSVFEKSSQLANVKLGSSYRWMAPELLLDPKAQTTVASDVFAFTMTSLEIWTEKPPYDGVVDPLVPGLILQGQPPNNPGNVSTALWKLWTVGWSKNPANRRLMADHVQDLEGVVGIQRYTSLDGQDR